MVELLIGKDYTKRVPELIDDIKISLDVAFFEFRYYGKKYPDHVSKIFMSIVNAQKRGVNVRVLLNASNVSCKSLGVNDEVKGRLEQQGCSVKIYKYGKKLHMKTLILDDKFLITGSHNISMSAMKKNIEMSAVIENKEIVRRAKEYFNILYSSI